MTMAARTRNCQGGAGRPPLAGTSGPVGVVVGIGRGDAPTYRAASVPPVASLNPALDAAQHCLKCGSAISKDPPRSLRCESCGFVLFFNPKPVAAAIPFTPAGEIVLLRRGFDPGQGLWTFPGGFIDLGESTEDAARRETMEEIGLDVTIDGLVGVYSRATDRVMLVVYRASTDGDRPQTTDEAPTIQAFGPTELPWDEMAFWSTTAALEDAIRET
jgi:ADP-ribose pyrophosphatase YjhB (NUDIX family)